MQQMQTEGSVPSMTLNTASKNREGFSVSVAMFPCQVLVFLVFSWKISGKCAEKMVGSGGRRKADIWKALLLESFLLSIAAFLTLATTSRSRSEASSTRATTTTVGFFLRKVGAEDYSVAPG